MRVIAEPHRAGLLRRLHEMLLGVPVFVKVMGIALGMAGLLGVGLLWQIHETWHAHLVERLMSRGSQLAEDVASRCAELSQAGLAAEIPADLEHALADSPDSAYLILEGRDGVVLAAARASENRGASRQIREVTAAVGEGAQRLRVGLSTARVEQEVGWLTRRLLPMTAVITLFGITATWWLTRLLTHPIVELVALTHRVQSGDYGCKARVRTSDEVGELAAAFNEMTATLAEKDAARHKLLHRLIRVGEEERKRIVRDLHDHTGQALTSLIAGLGALEAEAPEAATRRRLHELRRLIEQTLAEVHDLTVSLRPSVLDDLGLMAALQRHCRLFGQRSGIEAQCEEIGMDGNRLPADIELTLYRVSQEALTNAVRHGQATRVRVRVERLPDRVRAFVQDDGRGFDAHDWQQRCAASNRLGLLGIEERVSLLGGKFRVESAPGQGATVQVDIPLPPTP